MLARMRWAVFLLTGTIGCGGVLRYAPKGPSSDPPRIDRLVDLGALPSSGEGDLDQSESDGRFFPGERVAVIGRGLHGVALELDGEPLPAIGYLEGGSVVVRLPPSLSPRRDHRLTAGDASTTFASSLYVIGSDTAGDALRFLRVGPPGPKKRVEDPNLSVEQPRSLFHALSPDASLLYALGIEEKRGRGKDAVFVAEIGTIHLGAGGGPKRVGTTRLELSTQPTGIAVRGALMVVLSNDELVTLSLRDPLGPKELGRVSIANKDNDRHIDLLLLGDTAVLLEVTDNRVQTVSLASPAEPVVTGSLLLGPAEGFPFSTDLIPDPTDPAAFYVLQGVNVRTATRKVSEGRDGLVGLGKKGWDALTGGDAEETPEAPTFRVPKRGRLVRVRMVERSLTKDGMIELPEDFVGMFAVPGEDGAFYVSGVAPGALDAEKLDASLDGAAQILRFLKDSVQLGKIVRVDRTGESETVVQGVSVFFDLDLLPEGKLVYSGMRLSGRLSPPFVGVNWGVGLEGGYFYGVNKLDTDYFIPPYTYGQVSVQRGAL